MNNWQKMFDYVWLLAAEFCAVSVFFSVWRNQVTGSAVSTVLVTVILIPLTYRRIVFYHTSSFGRTVGIATIVFLYGGLWSTIYKVSATYF